MQMFPHFQNDEVAHVTLRLTKDEEMSLRAFMHIEELNNRVAFPHGVRMFYRSMGWYRLNASNTFRVSEKLKLATSIIRKWHREYDAARVQELRLLMLRANPEVKVTAYIDNQYLVRTSQSNSLQTVDEAYKVPAAADKLAALAQRFAR
jgi:hypothetical protein